MDEKVTLVFFGSEHYAPIVLDSLFKDPLIKLALVVSSQLPQKDIISPLKTLTDKNHVSLDYWASKDDLPSLKEKLISLDPRLFVVADFGQIIPQEIIDIPLLGTIVVHPSLLPKYRGTTPVPATILNGDKTAGVSLILMDTKVDHGPLLATVEIILKGDENAPELLLKLFTSGAEMIPTVIRNLDSKSLTCNTAIIENNDSKDKFDYKLYYPPLEQDHSQNSYTRRLERDSGRIDWSKTPEDIERMVRAYSGWPGTWTTVEELRSSKLKVQSAKCKVDSRSVKILRAHLGDKGELIIDQLQIEGKNTISWEEFARGYLR